jgi:hypothetical protein
MSGYRNFVLYLRIPENGQNPRNQYYQTEGTLPECMLPEFDLLSTGYRGDIVGLYQRSGMCVLAILLCCHYRHLVAKGSMKTTNNSKPPYAYPEYGVPLMRMCKQKKKFLLLKYIKKKK